MVTSYKLGVLNITQVWVHIFSYNEDFIFRKPFELRRLWCHLKR